MKISSKQLVNLALVAVAFALTAVVYDRLPERMPTHWNWKGEVDGWMPRGPGSWMLPVVNLVLYLVFLVLPRISPKGFEMEPFRNSYEMVTAAILAFMLLIQAAILLTSMGWKIPMTQVVFTGIGALFVVIGHGIRKITRNYFMGIRTPWTLSNDEVWKRTHELGGKLFMVAGALTAVAGFLPYGIWIILPGITVAALVPVVYSYFLYRALESGKTQAGKKSRR